jgi:hypothetical protein
MEQQQWLNLILFFAVLLGAYLLYNYLQNNNYLKGIEGMENNETTGVGAGADALDKKLLESIDKLKSELNISINRKKYEDIILKLDTWSRLFMLKSILIANSPEQTLPILALGSLSRTGLNNVLTFIDKAK